MHMYVRTQWRIQGVSLVSTETPFQISILNKIIYNHALINYIVKNILYITIHPFLNQLRVLLTTKGKQVISPTTHAQTHLLLMGTN